MSGWEVYLILKLDAVRALLGVLGWGSLSIYVFLLLFHAKITGEDDEMKREHLCMVKRFFLCFICSLVFRTMLPTTEQAMDIRKARVEAATDH